MIYHCPNIGQEEDGKPQNAMKEVSKGECVNFSNFNHIQHHRISPSPRGHCPPVTWRPCHMSGCPPSQVVNPGSSPSSWLVLSFNFA